MGIWVVAELVTMRGARIDLSLRIRRNDGAWVWLEGTATNLLDEPHVGAIVFNYHDVTERQAALHALRESEERYRTLFESSPSPMFVYDLETLQFLAVNEAAVLKYGYTADEFRAMTIREIRPEEDVPGVLQHIAETFEQPVVAVSGRHRTKDYQVIDVDIVSHLIDWGGRVARLVLVNEVTDRRRAEQALAKERNLLRTVIDNLPDLVFVKDRNNRFVLSNRATAMYMGAESPDALLGKTDADFYPSEIAEQYHATEAEVFCTGKAVVNLEELGIDRDGKQVHLLTSKIPLRGEDALVIGLVGIGHDITERKRTEAENVRRANEFSKLYETARALALEHDPAAVMGVISERLASLLDTPAIALLLFDADRGDLELVAGIGTVMAPGTRVRMGDGVVGTSALRREPMLVKEPEGWTGAPLFEDGLRLTQLSVPMVHLGELIGLVVAQAVAEPSFGEAEKRLLGLFASLAGSAIYNARLLAETRTRARQLALLYDAGLTLNRVLDSYSQLEFLVQIGMKAVNGERAEYFRFCGEENKFHVEVCIGFAEQVDRQVRALVIDGEDPNALVAVVGKERVPIYLPEVREDSPWKSVDEAVRSVLFVPLEHENVLIGVVAVMSTREHAFSPHDQRLLVLFANQAAIALENARLFEQIRTHYDRMEGLRTIDDVISSSLDLRLSLQVVLDQVVKQLGAGAADVYLLDEETRVFEFAAEVGFRAGRYRDEGDTLRQTQLLRTAMGQKTVFVPKIDLEKEWQAISVIRREGFVCYAAAPLIAKGQVKGVLELYTREEINPDAEWREYFGTLAKQAAIAVDNVQLFENLQRSNLAMELAHDSIIEGLSRALDVRDRETEGHTQRVTQMSLQLASMMGMSYAEMVHIRRGALLHDIGKLGVPDSILLKPAALTEEEWVVMRMHPVYAYDWLSPIGYLRPALDIPYCHHERWNGQGYPRGLAGEAIPLGARIFSVVDVWDALRSDRPYRRAWSEQETIAYIRSERGKMFDPEIVDRFLEMVDGVEGGVER